MNKKQKEGIIRVLDYLNKMSLDEFDSRIKYVYESMGVFKDDEERMDKIIEMDVAMEREGSYEHEYKKDE